ncbi:hypothetical protein LVD15_11825 [Fulvivirga maritima]|uniref:hypothetical protein n=1 Tax=Fulvivirga maritima TaxID=2904247 RepID=UPI001F1821F9|nr:hypothetical protein [Fulvivirga maritima]UII29084.1 hypothetical protein LVD15_11825 [Fulvivirga maritima]
MKRICIINIIKRSLTVWLLIILLITPGYAQTPNVKEFFQQKKTQRKYLLKQIALLQLYLGFVKKGYRIVDKGLHVIGDIKEGKFSLDKEYIQSLSSVKLQLSTSPQVETVSETLSLAQVRIQGTTMLVNETQLISASEHEYLSNMLKSQQQTLINIGEELDLILQDQHTEMKDAARLQRLDVVREAAQGLATITWQFQAYVRQLILSRTREQHELMSTKRLLKDD